MWQHVVLCRSSVAKSFNVNNLSVCIGWCADQVTLRSARCNDKHVNTYEVLTYIVLYQLL